MFWGVGSLRRRPIYEINNRCERVQLLRTRNHRELHIFKSWEILPLLGPAISHFKYFTNPVLFSPPPDRCCQDQLHNLGWGEGAGVKWKSMTPCQKLRISRWWQQGIKPGTRCFCVQGLMWLNRQCAHQARPNSIAEYRNRIHFY